MDGMDLMDLMDSRHLITDYFFLFSGLISGFDFI